MGSMRILDIQRDRILIVASNPTSSGTAFIVETKLGNIEKIKIDPIENHPILNDLESCLESLVLELNSKVHIVILKKKKPCDKMPLIIVPHGGPNSVYSVDYVFYPVILAKMGYAVASSKSVFVSINVNILRFS